MQYVLRSSVGSTRHGQDKHDPPMQLLPHEQPLWGISPTPLSLAEPEPKLVQTETLLTMQLWYLQI